MCVFVEFREGIKPLKREGLRYAFLMMLQSNAVMLPSSKGYAFTESLYTAHFQ